MIIPWDERLSTVSATKILNETNVRGEKRKKRVDSMAASFILQSYLNSLQPWMENIWHRKSNTIKW